MVAWHETILENDDNIYIKYLPHPKNWWVNLGSGRLPGV
jgi:hypothetical protein